MRRLYLFFFILIIYQSIWAQSSFSSGVLPRVRLSSKLTENIKWINGIESRQLFVNNTKESSLDYDYVLTDFSSLVSIKIGVNGVLNGGYLLRVEDNKTAHRTIQQYNIVHFYNAYRIGHRFATDQTFSKYEAPEFRTRYRITAEKPLSGDQIDPKEFYVKVSNEYLLSFQNQDTGLEVRVLPFLGYEINTKNKIEIGLDYRLGQLFTSRTENDLWLSFNWFYTFSLKPVSKEF